jgi:hypothetical protein
LFIIDYFFFIYGIIFLDLDLHDMKHQLAQISDKLNSRNISLSLEEQFEEIDTDNEIERKSISILVTSKYQPLQDKIESFSSHLKSYIQQTKRQQGCLKYVFLCLLNVSLCCFFFPL